MHRFDHPALRAPLQGGEFGYRNFIPLLGGVPPAGGGVVLFSKKVSTFAVYSGKLSLDVSSKKVYNIVIYTRSKEQIYDYERKNREKEKGSS